MADNELPAANTSGPRALVVDDSPTGRAVAARVLTAAGFLVETAASGEEAFERCLAEVFDLVVSDLQMGAVSGSQLCRLLHSDPSTADMPVILLTSADDPRSRFWGRASGALAHVSKNDLHSRLVDEARRVVGIAPRRQEPAAGGEVPAAPVERLARLLDELLFESTLAAEIRQLVSSASEPRRFCRGLLELVAEVAGCDYLAVRLAGTGGDVMAVHARGPWPDDDREGCRVLGCDDPTAAGLEVLRGPSSATGPVIVSDVLRLDLGTGGVVAGGIMAAAARGRIAVADRELLGMVAVEAAVLTRTVTLLEETRRLATTDALTGIANRRRILEVLDDEIQRARRYDGTLSVLVADVDRFKRINDRWGHTAGDAALVAVARCLDEQLRRVDRVGRWGGEEFLVVLPQTAETGALQASERLRACVAGIRLDEIPAVRLTVSIGVATLLPDEDADRLVARADDAMFAAKRGGRNRVEVAVGAEDRRPSDPAPIPVPDPDSVPVPDPDECGGVPARTHPPR